MSLGSVLGQMPLITKIEYKSNVGHSPTTTLSASEAYQYALVWSGPSGGVACCPCTLLVNGGNGYLLSPSGGYWAGYATLSIVNEKSTITVPAALDLSALFFSVQS